MKTYTITVDIMDNTSQDVHSLPVYNQGDINTSVLNLNITQDDVPYDLTGSSVSVFFIKSDGTVVYQDSTNGLSVTNAINGNVSVNLNTQTLAALGRVIGAVKIQNGNSTIETGGFYFVVKKSLTSEQALASDNEVSPILGTATLTTTDKSIKGAINEVNANKADKTTVGDLTTLTTADKDTLVHAINDNVNSLSGLNTSIGNLSNLTTSDKSSLVNAINTTVTTKADKTALGDITTLTTQNKTNVVAAINENVSSLASKVSKDVTYVNALDMPSGFTNFIRNDNTKDNSPALQYLFDHITNADGDFVVYFPMGNYYFSTNVTKRCPRNVILLGSQGRNDYASTTRFIFNGTGAFIDIKCSNPANDNCNFSDSTTWNANLYNGVGSLRLQNIWLATAQGSPYKAGTYGIRDWRGGDIILEDCTLQGWEIGFWAIESDFNSFKRVTVKNNHSGMFLGPRSNQNLLEEIYTYQNDTAIEFNGCQGANVQACYFVEDDTNAIAPLKVDCKYGDTEVIFNGCWYEDTSTAGGYDGFISIGENSDTSKALVVMINNPAMHLIGRHAYFVRLDYGTGITFSNVRLRNNLKLLHTIGTGTNSPFVSFVNVSNTMAGTVDSNIVNSGYAPKLSGLTNNNGVPAIYSNTQNRFDLQLGTSTVYLKSNYGFTGFNIEHSSFPNSFIQFRKRILYSTSAPADATAYAVGDICFNSAPTAGGKIGWVCTTAGTPGTWKAFGVIDA